jgi:hypothetical protein
MAELHRDYSVWFYEEQFGFAVELPTETARRVLPHGLHPFEVRPGTAILTVNTLCFAEGNHGFGRAFHEVTIGINVVPNLFQVPRLPKFSVHVLNIGVSDTGFLTDDYNTDRLPFHQSPLRFDVDRERRRVRCADDHGPVFDLFDTGPAPDWQVKEDFFQVFASWRGALQQGSMSLEGNSFEHQRSGPCGRLFDHPFWKGAAVATEAAEPYMQLFTGAPGGIQHYHRLQPSA